MRLPQSDGKSLAIQTSGVMLRQGGNMERNTWLLLALEAAGRSGLTPAQLQKSLFLLDKEIPQSFAGGDRYYFSAYNYGPFSKQIYDDAERLAAEGLVSITRAEGQNFNDYRITAVGEERAARLKSGVNSSSLGYLKIVVDWAKTKSFSELVRAIYAKYPEFRANSVFQY
jgi:uncharacterized protein